MRIFGGERVKALMFRLGMTEGVPIESGLISRRIENAQKSVEAQNFDARKHLLEYDDVMNKQRGTFYGIRRSRWKASQRDYVIGIAEDIARELVDTYCAGNYTRPVEHNAISGRSEQRIWYRREGRGCRSHRVESRPAFRCHRRSCAEI